MRGAWETSMSEQLSEHSWRSLFARLFPNGLDDSAIARELPGPRWQELSREAIADLLGQCLWDVFSNNHEVFTAEGAVVDLGTFRAASPRSLPTSGPARPAAIGRAMPGATSTTTWALWVSTVGKILANSTS